MTASALPEDFPLSFESPESSVVAGASYDPGTKQLTVEIRRSSQKTKKPGDTDGVIDRYLYAGVDSAIWREFALEKSKGSFFAKVIRPVFTGTLQPEVK